MSELCTDCRRPLDSFEHAKHMAHGTGGHAAIAREPAPAKEAQPAPSAEVDSASGGDAAAVTHTSVQEADGFDVDPNPPDEPEAIKEERKPNPRRSGPRE